jgi:hypothetical protein
VLQRYEYFLQTALFCVFLFLQVRYLIEFLFCNCTIPYLVIFFILLLGSAKKLPLFFFVALPQSFFCPFFAVKRQFYSKTSPKQLLKSVFLLALFPTFRKLSSRPKVGGSCNVGKSAVRATSSQVANAERRGQFDSCAIGRNGKRGAEPLGDLEKSARCAEKKKSASPKNLRQSIL